MEPPYLLHLYFAIKSLSAKLNMDFMQELEMNWLCEAIHWAGFLDLDIVDSPRKIDRLTVELWLIKVEHQLIKRNLGMSVDAVIECDKYYYDKEARLKDTITMLQLV